MFRHAVPDHNPDTKKERVRVTTENGSPPPNQALLKKIPSHIPDTSVRARTVADSIYHQHHHVRRHCEMTSVHADPSYKKVFTSLCGVWQSTSRINAALRWKDFDQLSPLLSKPTASCWLTDPEAEIALCFLSTCPLVQVGVLISGWGNTVRWSSLSLLMLPNEESC